MKLASTLLIIVMDLKFLFGHKSTHTVLSLYTLKEKNIGPREYPLLNLFGID